MTTGPSLPDRLRKAADELESLRCAEDAALMREAAEALDLESTLAKHEALRRIPAFHFEGQTRP